jgi:hypothetical protein
MVNVTRFRFDSFQSRKWLNANTNLTIQSSIVRCQFISPRPCRALIGGDAENESASNKSLGEGNFDVRDTAAELEQTAS